MTRISFYVVCVILLVLQPLSKAEAGIAERNSFLKETLVLAEKPNPYFLINLGENKIFLMAKGVVIREWCVDKTRFMGDPPPLKSFPLEGKSIQVASLRNNIDVEGNKVVNNSAINKTDADNKVEGKIKENKTGEEKKRYEVVALELDDMPADYQLFLSGGIPIMVRSQAEGFEAFIKKTSHLLKWYAYYPILALWSSHHKPAFTKIDLFFKDKTEAQALFWAFSEEMECIILPPGLENSEDFRF